ncbi:MAG: CRISPR-associated endonuclease Cas1 [Acidimicrobiales bacterium]|nr:CRISPR-associated endonuclease Cas1 [Acidimicrobiales bacterium]
MSAARDGDSGADRRVDASGTAAVKILSTVYVTDHRAKVGVRKGSLTVARESGNTRIPMEGIDSVLLLGRAQITSDALANCAARGIRVASLKRNGALRFACGGPMGGNVHLRSAQHAAAVNVQQSLELARRFVAAKIRNSCTVVDRWSRDADGMLAATLRRRSLQIRERLGRIGAARDGDHLRGIEGDAARLYFTCIGQALSESPLSFAARSRRPPRDPVNAAMSFCYGLLTTELIGGLDAVGLDHQVGFLHRARSGSPSLALDLAEELRPVCDRFVVTLVRRRQLGPSDFERVPGGAVYFNDGGRGRLLDRWEEHREHAFRHAALERPIERWALPTVQATLLARHLRGDLPVYPPFVLS